MTWLLPTAADIPAIGEVRSVGRFDRRAYDRAYYHLKRRGRVQRPAVTPEQRARRRKQRHAQYHANPDRERANARARYWRNRDRYAAAARQRSQQRKDRP